MLKQKIRIRLKSFDHSLVFQSASEIVSTVKRTGAEVSGPVPLPKKIKKYTVNRSPHVDKESREQFEVRTYKSIIIISPTAETIDALRKLDLAAGVDVDIKLLEA
jgi:small subunit ribosomal protein S10